MGGWGEWDSVGGGGAIVGLVEAIELGGGRFVGVGVGVGAFYYAVGVHWVVGGLRVRRRYRGWDWCRRWCEHFKLVWIWVCTWVQYSTGYRLGYWFVFYFNNGGVCGGLVAVREVTVSWRESFGERPGIESQSIVTDFNKHQYLKSEWSNHSNWRPSSVFWICLFCQPTIQWRRDHFLEISDACHLFADFHKYWWRYRLMTLCLPLSIFSNIVSDCYYKKWLYAKLLTKCW